MVQRRLCITLANAELRNGFGDCRIKDLRSRNVASTACSLSKLLLGEAANIQRCCGLGITGQYSITVRYRRRIISHEEIYKAAIKEGLVIIRLEADRLVVVSDGEMVLALTAVGRAAIVEGLVIIRLQADRLVVIGDSEVVL